MKSIKYQVADSKRIRDVLAAVYGMVNRAVIRGPVDIILTRPSRSLDQNRLMWPLLTDISKQVEHFGNKYTPEDWKALLTASFEETVRSAPTLDGKGLVFLGGRTSKYSKRKFSNFIEFIYSEGAERGVVWSEKSNDSYQQVTSA